MTPARKPRTECCCHSVAAIIAATVAPDDARSIVISRACLLSARAAVIDDRTFDCVSDLRTAILLLGERDIFVRADLGLGMGGRPASLSVCVALSAVFGCDGGGRSVVEGHRHRS